jgi:hypothetical protein
MSDDEIFNKYRWYKCSFEGYNEWRCKIIDDKNKLHPETDKVEKLVSVNKWIPSSFDSYFLYKALTPRVLRD